MAVVQYKTPGVYVEEIDAFPPSIVGVETAVPVFIGYTEKAEKNGRSVKTQPVRITSMVDYVPIFGGAPKYQFTFKPLPITKHDLELAQKKEADAQILLTAKTKANEDAQKNTGLSQAAKDAAKNEFDAATKTFNDAKAAREKLEWRR